MNINELKDLISNFGVPLVFTATLAYVYYKEKQQDRLDNKEREERYLRREDDMKNTLNRITEANKELVETNRTFVNVINAKVDTLENKIDNIDKKISI